MEMLVGNMMKPMEGSRDLMNHVDLKNELSGYNNEQSSCDFELKYFGYREITSSTDLCVLDQDGASIP